MKAADLKKSILQAAFLGELTVDWRMAHGVTKQWKQATIEQFLTKERKPMSTGPFGTMIKKHEHCLHGVPVLGIENIGEGRFIPGNKIFVTHEKAEYLKAFVLHTEDIIISRSGTVGELCLVPSCMEGALLSTNLMRITLDKQTMLPKFFIYLFQSKGVVTDQVKELCRGSTRVFLNQNILKQIVFPLPSLTEQQRIVAKVDELMVICDELEAAENKLKVLEDHFVEYLPKSILQAAVQGKLIPQDKSDEPASELLKRIQAEKAKLIKESKLKKEKPLPPIAEDESPYDLPEGWVWCRLGELVQLISGRDLEPNAYNDQNKGIPYITGASAIINNKIDVVRWTEYPVVISSSRDILLSCKGTVGKIIHNTIGDCHIARQIMAIRIPVPEVDSHYLALALETFVTQLVTQAKSMIPGISREDVLYLVFPLPPLAEQKRIVAKVYELMALCDELKHVGEQPIDHNKVIQFPAEAEGETEPLQMAAQGKVFEQPSKKHAAALDDLVEMMDDD